MTVAYLLPLHFHIAFAFHSLKSGLRKSTRLCNLVYRGNDVRTMNANE